MTADVSEVISLMRLLLAQWQQKSTVGTSNYLVMYINILLVGTLGEMTTADTQQIIQTNTGILF